MRTKSISRLRTLSGLVALGLSAGACHVDCTTASDCNRGQFCGDEGFCEAFADGGNGLFAQMAVLAVQPEPSSSQNPALGPVVVVTDKTVDASTLTSATFSLADSHGQNIAGTFELVANPDGFLFAPTMQLTAGATFSARVTTGIRATDGTELSAPVSWTFTIAP